MTEHEPPLTAEREAEIRKRFAELDNSESLLTLAEQYAKGDSTRATALLAAIWGDERDILDALDAARARLQNAEDAYDAVQSALSAVEVERDNAGHRAEVAERELDAAGNLLGDWLKSQPSSSEPTHWDYYERVELSEALLTRIREGAPGGST